MRTIGFAYKDMDVADWEQFAADCNNFEDDEQKRKLVDMDGLTLAGVLGLKTPLRTGSPEMIKTVKKWGVNIRMITGDNIITAKNVAVSAGICTSEEAERQFACMESGEIDQLIQRGD